MMNEMIRDGLGRSGLFAGLTRDEVSGLCASLHVTARNFAREQVLAFEDDPCEAIGIVASGMVHIRRIYPSGKSITIETIGAGESFGEALLFAEPGVYPATLIAAEAAQVIYLSKADVMALLGRSPRFLENFMRSLSNRILLLNRRIKGLSFTTVRQKVANAMLELRSLQGGDNLTLPYTRQDWADALGIPRPSLSRELAGLKEAGVIDYGGRRVHLLDVPTLEKYLLR